LERAERLLKRLATDAISRPGSLIEIQVLRAIAKCASGDVNTARGVLSRALESAAPGRWTRVFVDEGPQVHDLLRTLAGRRHPADRPEPLSPEAWRHLLFVLDAFEASQPGKATPLSEALSERELEVLQLIAAGRPNADIAQTLFVTPDTVKKHVTHILGKLGVSNRTEAAARARELSLIS
jgi:LuxR family maltose regulon positive regulatory protein